MRKVPQQARSRDMVERIVTAGRAVLVRDGYDVFSTNRVAEAADISPGSLYQYFPDKTAILSIIVDRYLADVSERVAAALSSQLGKSLPELVRGTVDALLAALESNPELLRVVTEELPARQIMVTRGNLEQRIRDLTMAVGAALLPQSGRNLSVISWVMVHAMEALSVRWVLGPPTADRDVIIDELTLLALSYLQVDTAALSE